jgi:hypothetical protein
MTRGGRATGSGHAGAGSREGDAGRSGITGPGLRPEGHGSLAAAAAYVAVVKVGAGVMVAAVVAATEGAGGWCRLCGG